MSFQRSSRSVGAFARAHALTGAGRREHRGAFRPRYRDCHEFRSGYRLDCSRHLSSRGGLARPAGSPQRASPADCTAMQPAGDAALPRLPDCATPRGAPRRPTILFAANWRDPPAGGEALGGWWLAGHRHRRPPASPRACQRAASSSSFNAVSTLRSSTRSESSRSVSVLAS